MEQSLIFKFCYGGMIKLVCVDTQKNYKYILTQVIEQWPELGRVRFNALCVVGDLSNIYFTSQEDLDSIRLICDVSCVRSVSVALSCVLNVVNESAGVNGGSEFDNNESSCVDEWHMEAVRNSGKANLSKLRKTESHGVQVFGVDVYKNCSTEVESVVDDLEGYLGSRGQQLMSDGWEDFIKGDSGFEYRGSIAEFRSDLIKYSIKIGVKFKFIRNTAQVVHVICCQVVVSDCDWFLKGRVNVVTDVIKVEVCSKPHLCVHKVVCSMDATTMPAKLIGELMIGNARNNQCLNGKDVIHAMKNGYGLNVTYTKARRAAEYVKKKVFGDFSNSYDELKDYCLALKLTNPGSVVVLEASESTNRFERLFISFYASIKGFQYCPPLLFIDGTYLRGPFKGTLLVAIAKDGNKGLFPVAFGLVSAENTDNWSWFLQIIKDEISHPKKITYLSDRNSGLMAAFSETFEEPVHYFCVYHLLGNLKARFCTGVKKKKHPQYISLFKECAYEPDPIKFDRKLKEFLIIGGNKAVEWLSQLPYHKWAISFSSHITRYGELTSNAAESFNAWILPARSLPVTKMVDFIRSGLSQWFVERRKVSLKWLGMLVPRKEEMWNSLSRIGVTWSVVPCPGNDFKVLSLPTTCVDLRSRICSCHEWQSSGFPCCHAVAVIKNVRIDISGDVDPFFLVSFYKKKLIAGI